MLGGVRSLAPDEPLIAAMAWVTASLQAIVCFTGMSKMAPTQAAELTFRGALHGHPGVRPWPTIVHVTRRQGGKEEMPGELGFRGRGIRLLHFPRPHCSTAHLVSSEDPVFSRGDDGPVSLHNNQDSSSAQLIHRNSFTLLSRQRKLSVPRLRPSRWGYQSLPSRSSVASSS